MRAQDYIQASTYVRVREKSFLTREQWERLIEAPALEEALRVLQESAYGVLLQKLDDPRDFEKALVERLEEDYEEMNRFAKDPDLIRFLRLRYDTHNEKVLLKEHFFDASLEELIMPLATADVSAGRVMLRDADRAFSKPEHIQKAMEAYEKKRDPQALAHPLDHHYLSSLSEMADKLGSALLKEYATLQIDYYNLLTLLRAQGRTLDLQEIDPLLVTGGHIPVETLKGLFFSSVASVLDAVKRYLPDALVQGARDAYENEQRLSALERAFDVYILGAMQEGSQITYGPEVLFNYLIQLENEVRNLRVILVSKISSVEPARIRERIRRHA